MASAPIATSRPIFSSLDEITAWGEVFVPGVGPVGGRDEVAELRGYLAAVRAAANRGAGAALSAGPWQRWADTAYRSVNIERAAMLAGGDTSPPPSALALFGLA